MIPSDGTAPTGGAITIDMSKLPDPADPTPGGGSFVYSDGVSNLHSDLSEVLRVTYFDAACDAVVLDGTPLDGKTTEATAARWRITEGKNSALVLLGAEGAVILRGVSLVLWQAGAARQIHGTAGDDNLVGTEQSDVFWSGGGSDRIAPAAGDDHIGYSVGDDVILNTPVNSGSDTLNLRRFSAADLGFTAQAADLIITTPIGKITLQDQLLGAGNLEMILLADDQTLTASDLQALSTQ